MTPQQVERVHWRILELIDAARMAMGEVPGMERSRAMLDELRLNVKAQISAIERPR